MVYAKAVMAVLTAIAAALLGFLTDGITPEEWVNVAIAGVGAAGILTAPNIPGFKYTKTILAVLTAGLMVLVGAIDGGLTLQEWFQIGVACLGAVGVWRVPNKGADLY